jgi:probable phosphomutase (TIGR03848 family)
VASVPTVIFVRHGRSSANTSGTLAGWMPGVFLDDTGEAQAAAVGQRIASATLAIAEIVSSPLDRCVQTADLLAAPLPKHVRRSIHEGLGECRYGAWTGRPISQLATEELWKVVQDRPSEARFPDSAAYAAESMVEMQDRALRAVRETDARILETHGKDAIWVAVSHGDVIKSILSHATGAHLDDFQRINVDPASVSVVRYTSRKPFVLRLNDVGGDLGGLRPPEKSTAAEGDAVVGGGAGTAETVG